MSKNTTSNLSMTGEQILGAFIKAMIISDEMDASGSAEGFERSWCRLDAFLAALSCEINATSPELKGHLLAYRMRVNVGTNSLRTARQIYTGQRNEWSAEYLRAAFADEIELAWAKLRRRYVAPSPIGPHEDLRAAPRRGGSLITAGSARLMLGSTEPAAPPHWRRSWAAAGPLIGELGLSIRTDDEEGAVSVGNGSRRRDVTESYADHPNKDAAIYAAIVRAAIRVCTEARELY